MNRRRLRSLIKTRKWLPTFLFFLLAVAFQNCGELRTQKFTPSAIAGSEGPNTLPSPTPTRPPGAPTPSITPIPTMTPLPTMTPTPTPVDVSGFPGNAIPFSQACWKPEPSANDLRFVPPHNSITPFGGNGHSQTWDGQVFVVTRGGLAPRAPSDGWAVFAIRPSRIQRDSAGKVIFPAEVASPQVVLEVDGAPNSAMGSHNALALVPDPDFVENPFRSNADGTANPVGTHATYRLFVYTQFYEQGKLLGRRKARIVVANPKTENASIAKAELLTPFEKLGFGIGYNYGGIEPSLTFDGRLMIFNRNAPDQIMYSFNPDPRALSGWSDPKPITSMHSTHRNVLVDGIAFHERYPFAKNPMRDFEGNVLAPGSIVPGAYPWISLDGEDMFFTTAIAFDGARRTGMSIVGSHSAWAVKHIDGPINPNLGGGSAAAPTVRLFFSSPAQLGSMWRLYPEYQNLAIPNLSHRPSYLLFGSNTSNYVEVPVHETVDGSYVFYSPMNQPLIPNTGTFIQDGRTPDTSGNFLRVLPGSATTPEYRPKFPKELPGMGDIMAGVNGQGVHFYGPSYYHVYYNQLNGTPGSLSRLNASISVELWVKRLQNLSNPGDPLDRPRYLIRRDGQFGILLEETGQPHFGINLTDGSEVRTGPVGTALPIGEWVHLAMTFNSRTGEFTTYRNGTPEIVRTVSKSPLRPLSVDMFVGPGTAEATPFLSPDLPILVLDEVAVSSVARTAAEIRTSAFRTVKPTTPATAPLPLGLPNAGLQRSLASTIPGSFELGQLLFFDKRLSRNSTMSCATCHDPGKNWTDLRVTSQGFNGQPLTRNSPTLWNRAFGKTHMWDGSANTLEAQALLPISNPMEMNLPIAEAVAFLNGNPHYKARFQKVFGEIASEKSLSCALALFQSSLFSGRSPVDRFEAGDLNAITEAQKRGRILFNGKAKCVACHDGPNYSDEQFHKLGLNLSEDTGRAAVSGRASDAKKFKTPTLRNIAQTAPYFHNGSVANLNAVLALYNSGGADRANSELQPLGMTAQELADLEVFLQALTSSESTSVAPPTPLP
jgi:cytochrome c peroxidase